MSLLNGSSTTRPTPSTRSMERREVDEPASGKRMNHEQRELLLLCIRLYLNYQWTRVVPSPERNMLIRVLQALQGRLLEPLEQLAVPPTKPLWLSEEEQIVTRKMLNELLQGPAKLPELNAPD